MIRGRILGSSRKRFDEGLGVLLDFIETLTLLSLASSDKINAV